ncbi:MAG: hypothetical protein RML72_02665 [Bacteroidia bacterium]|nr:hypothetical protein [Bacteroidia bacterium]MDW8157763.1 hypothetical protein [Bacteroidia bacterium]
MKVRPLKILLAIGIGLGIWFAGCSDEEKELNPTLTLDGGNEFVASNKEMEPETSFKVKVTANKGKDGKDLDKFEIKVSYDGAVPQRDTLIEKINSSSFTLTRNLRTRKSEGTERWIFTITDKDGKTAERSFTITVKKKDTNPPPPIPPNSFTLNLNNTNAFASSSDGLVYNAANGQANASKVDLTYFFSSVSGNNMASPAARKDASIYSNFAITWGTVQTEFRNVSVTAAEFDALNDQSRIKTFFDGGTPTKVTQSPDGTRFNTSGGDFVANKVIAFHNRSTNKYGLIKIVSVAADANSSAVVQIKVQK